MTKLRALLVDDELLALKLLQSILERRDDIDVIGLCRNGREAKESINSQHPDIVFLDINMPSLNGIQVATYLDSADIKKPLIIFTTAFERHALDAFEVGATDYLLKPLDADRVAVAIERAKRRLKISVDDSKEEQDEATITIKDGSRINVVNQCDIQWIDAAGDYMCVHVGDETLITRATMKELLEKLDHPYLVRVHRSSIVNLKDITAAEKLPKGEYLLTLRSGQQLKVSRNYRTAVAEFLDAKNSPD